MQNYLLFKNIFLRRYVEHLFINIFIYILIKIHIITYFKRVQYLLQIFNNVSAISEKFNRRNCCEIRLLSRDFREAHFSSRFSKLRQGEKHIPASELSARVVRNAFYVTRVPWITLSSPLRSKKFPSWTARRRFHISMASSEQPRLRNQ